MHVLIGRHSCLDEQHSNMHEAQHVWIPRIRRLRVRSMQFYARLHSHFSDTKHYSFQESKLYGAHFREIDVNAPKATKVKFGDSDDES